MTIDDLLFPGLAGPWTATPDRLPAWLEPDLRSALSSPGADPSCAFVAAGRVLRTGGHISARARSELMHWVEAVDGEVLAVVMGGLVTAVSVGEEVLEAWAAHHADEALLWRAEGLGEPAEDLDDVSAETLWDALAIRDDAESRRVCLALAYQRRSDGAERLRTLDAALCDFDRMGELLVGEFVAALRPVPLPARLSWLLARTDESTTDWWLHTAKTARLRLDGPVGDFFPSTSHVSAFELVRVALAGLSANDRQRFAGPQLLPPHGPLLAAAAVTVRSTLVEWRPLAPDANWYARIELPPPERAADEAVVELDLFESPAGTERVVLGDLERDLEPGEHGLLRARFSLAELRAAAERAGLALLSIEGDVALGAIEPG